MFRTSSMSDMSTLKNLRILNLAYCNLQSISVSLVNCENLQEIYMQQHHCSTFPDIFTPTAEARGATKLTVLKLPGCPGNTFSLPESLALCTNLTELDIAYTPTRTLPSNLGNIVSLVKLDIQSTGITSLPPSTIKCTALKKLMIGGSLTSMPHGWREVWSESIIYDTIHANNTLLLKVLNADQ